GADGVVGLGTTGEYPSFSVAERKKVAETAFKHRNGLNLIICSGTSNFPETIELSQHAEANGADGLLIVPPFYYKHPRLDGLTKYYSLIFEQVELPNNLYHIPFASGVPVSLELLHSLEKYPNLAGIKDSVSDPVVYQQFVAEFPKLNMRTGTTENLKYALDHGMGAILAEGNNFTKQVAAVFAAKRAGKDIGEPIAKLEAAMKLLRASAQYHPKDTEWPSYAADLAGTRYRPLDQINASNFNDLEIAWRIKTDNFGDRPEYKLEGTPLMVNGVLYATAGSRRAVIAV